MFLLAAVPDAGRAFSIVCVGAIVGLLVFVVAGIVFKKLPNGLFPMFVLAPLGSIVPILVGYYFELTNTWGAPVCVAFILGGPVLLTLLYGLVTKKWGP